MFKLLRLIVVLVVVVGAAAFFLGYWEPNGFHSPISGAPIGTAGHVDTERAREAGAAVGAKTAEAANKAGVVLAEGALTARSNRRWRSTTPCSRGPSTSRRAATS